MTRWLIPTAVLIAVAAAIAFWIGSSQGEPVQAARAVREDIREYIDERGKTRLPRTYDITMPFSGRIEEIVFGEGEKFEKDQVVARISPLDIEDEIAEAQAAVDRLDAAIAENDDITVENRLKQQAARFVESMASTVAAAEARQTSGKKRLIYAETFLGRVRKLAATGAKSQEELEQADVAFVESQVEYQQDVLIAEALKSIEAATKLLPEVVSDYTTRKSLTRTVLEKQKAEAEARLRGTKTKRQRSVMRSPIDGVVLERAVVNESYLSAGQLLLKIGEVDQIQIEADILSQDVVSIKPGQKVEIYGSAVGRTEENGVPGVVDRIYPAGFSKISSLGVEQQRVTVIIRFAENELSNLQSRRELGVGYRVRARVITSEQTAALVVPRSSLFPNPDGGWSLFVIRKGRVRLQAVKVGLMNDRKAAIISGIDEGELVVLAPDSHLQDAQRVKPI